MSFIFVYRLVIDSISPLEPERKCFRMVGGVLVERTIKEVLPALETNYGGVSYGIIPATRTFGLTFSLFM